MADEKSAVIHSFSQSQKHKPLSLNQRHNRVLIDLSAASHSKTLPKVLPEEDDNRGRRRLGEAFFSVAENQNDDVPSFSGITDFDSPLNRFTGQQEQVQPKPTAEEDDFPNFGFVDFDSPAPPPPADEMKPPQPDVENREVSIEDEDVCQTRRCNSSEVSDSLCNSEGEEEKQVKVRIEGRRRLCKISKKDDGGEKVKNEISRYDEVKYSGISDFDSPPPVKNAVESGYDCGGNEIRDILNDLSSRLEILSIEKKREPEKIFLAEDCKSLIESEVNHMKSKAVYPECESAASSFSITGSSTLGLGKESRISGATSNTFEKTHYLDDESEHESYLGKDNVSKNHGERVKVNNVKRVGGNSVSRSRFFMTNILKEEEEEGDENDCVVLSGKEIAKKVERRHEKFNQHSNDLHEVDVLEDYVDDYVLEKKHSIMLTDSKFRFILPGKIAKMLYPHQRDGLKWLWSLHCKGVGGVLGDDMGLGKTMQICGFLAGLFRSNLIKRALVVAPKTLLPHWIKELSIVGLSEKTREYFGTNVHTRQYELQYVLQDRGVLLTTYDIVRHNAKSLSGDYYYHDGKNDDDITWDYMILDEGHLIKNPSTQRAKSLLEIPAAHRIIISGTPLQNNLKELWALFNFCCPELLGDKKWFKDKYEKLINRGNEKNASEREKRIGSTVAKDLREKIHPYFLRRLKSEVFCENDGGEDVKLSKKNEIIVWLKLSSCQRQIYEAFLKSEIVLSAFDGSPLAALTILKKICDHPLLLTKRAAEDVLEGMDTTLNQQDHGVAEKLAMHIADVAEKFDIIEKHDISCKTSFILSLLDDLIPKGHHVLIFSQTRKMLTLIQESLVSNGYEFMRIDGTTKACDRLKIVNDFQEGRGASIFLLTSQVGGLGLTLTKADRVIVVDPAWNPSTDNQSVDRAYRIGQKKDVVVYRLMTCGTVEEKIYRMQIFKGGLFRTATEHKEQIRYFSKQDLCELFSLPKQGFDVSLTQRQLFEEHDQQNMMEESLKVHTEFLESLGISGVSQHSLLFSKTAPAPVPVAQEKEMSWVRINTFVTNSSSGSSFEHVDGAQYAFNPKDVKLHQTKSSPNANEPTEDEIRERINRLSQIFANKGMISKLPDKGERIQKQIAELKLELQKIQLAQRTQDEIVHLDDISGEFQRALNLKM